MSDATKEKDFEAHIESHLLSTGYLKGTPRAITKTSVSFPMK